MPTRMKPITGLIRKRAKAGMTIPAAPRITSASLKPEVLKSARLAMLAFKPRSGRICQPSDGSDDDTPISLIVGGGPAGMMAGLLFARAGCRRSVLEKHADFFRDFRGDTVHPSTMEILDQLGMLERFLERPHNRVDSAPSCGSPAATGRSATCRTSTRRRRSSR